MIACSVFLVLMGTQLFSPAQAQTSVESRLNRLESDLAVMRNQMNQRAGIRPGVNVPAPSTAIGSQPTVVYSDPRFDRLAILVIELKERVNTLEQKLAQLERPSR